MQIKTTNLPGVLVVEPKVFRDARGFFLEAFHGERYREAGIDANFVQYNHSRSQKGVLRGMHFQRNKPQGKLVNVSRGAVYDVVVDIDPDSATFGQHFGIELNDDNHLQLWVPPGYAHGFCVLTQQADLHYRSTEYYDSEDEGGIIWNDPQVNIDWPIKLPLMSDRDKQLPTLSELTGK